MSVSQGFYFTIQLKTPEYYFKINLTIQKNALNVSFHAARTSRLNVNVYIEEIIPHFLQYQTNKIFFVFPKK